MVQLDEEIFKLLEDGSNIQYEQPQKAKELFFEAQSRAQALENHKLNIVAGFNLGTVLINNGEPRNGVEQLLKVLSLLPENTDDIGIDTQWLYYNLGIGLAYVGEWSTCFSVLEHIINPALYAKACMTRGKAAERMRKFDIALSELKKAREEAEKAGDWGTASKVYFIESKVNQSVKDTKKARENLHQASEMARKIHNPIEKNDQMSVIGEAYIEARLYEDAQKVLTGVTVDENPKTCFLLGYNLINLRKHEEAIPYFQRAAKHFFMANNLELAGLCYIEEGKALLKLNKLAQALDAFKTALTTFEDINITSIRKAHGLWNSNGGIGEVLFKQQSKDCIEPLAESILLLQQERKNIDAELQHRRKMLNRAKRQFKRADHSDDAEQTDESTLTTVSRVSCPRIMNVLHGHEGKMLNRPFLQKNKQSYREQLLMNGGLTYKQQTLAKKPTNELPSIMPRQSGFISTVAISSTNQKPAKPVRKGNRRENYGSTDKRPESASNYGLRQEVTPGSSRSSSAETPADLLKQYEEGLKAPRPDY